MARTSIALNQNDRNTILAALRTRQAILDGTPMTESWKRHIEDIATNSDTGASSDSADIDDLCERLNT